METKQIIKVLDSYKVYQETEAIAAFEERRKRIIKTAGSQTESLFVSKERFLRLERKKVHVPISIRLTNSINKLGNEFENVVAIVPNDEKNFHEKITASNGSTFEAHIIHTHSYNMKINDKLGVNGIEPIEISCRKGAELVQEVLTNKNLSKLKDSIITTLYHEKAHFFKSRKIPWTAELKGEEHSYILLPDRSEIRAQLYALTKSKDPIGSMGSLIAMSFHLNYRSTMMEFLNLQLRHWSEPSILDYSASSLFDFSFPLADHAKEEVIKVAKSRLRLLRKYAAVS